MADIPVFRPYWNEEEIAAVTAVINSGWWGQGPVTAQLEQEFAAYVGAPYAVAVNSCTAALHLSLIVEGVGPGDEVITPALTFVSTNHAVRYVGATPVFADVEPDTLCINPVDVARKVTPRTKAVIAVHYGGHPADMDRLHALARLHNLIVIEDAAHAAGAEYHGRKVGSISPYTCFSFHAVKNMASGDGGMITLHDEEATARLRRLRWLGIDKDTWQRSEGNYRWDYEVNEVGYKYNFNDILASIALVQLHRLDSANTRRREICAMYDQGLAEPPLKRPVERPGCVSARHNYVVRTDSAAALSGYLRERGISTGLHYVPNDMHPVYQESAADLPVTHREWQRMVTLPLYPAMSNDDVRRVIDAVHEGTKVKAS
jgi:perosamine synthetase